MSDEQYFVPIGVVEVIQPTEARFGTVYVCTNGKLMRAEDIRAEEPRWEDITPPGTRVVYREFADHVHQPECDRLLEVAENIGKEWARQHLDAEPMEIDMGDLPTEQDLAARDFLIEALSVLRSQKPEERSSKARYYSVAITDLEKVCAYFNAYVCVGAESGK